MSTQKPFKVVGLMIVRGDAWSVGFALRVARFYCDQVVVLVHDARPNDEVNDQVRQAVDEVAAAYPGFVSRYDHLCPKWDEMHARQITLDLARALNATHMAIIDADEALTWSVVHDARVMIRALRPKEALAFRMISPWMSLVNYRHDGNFGEHSQLTFAFADHPELCWRPAADGYQFHMRAPRGIAATNIDRPNHRSGGVVHLQFASRKRLQAKAVWYKMLEQATHPGRMSAQELDRKYDWALQDTKPAVSPMPDDFLNSYGPAVLSHLRNNDEPWQLLEASRLLAEHPACMNNIRTHGLTFPSPKSAPAGLSDKPATPARPQYFERPSPPQTSA